MLLGCAPIDKQLRSERFYDSQWARAIAEQEGDPSLAQPTPTPAATLDPSDVSDPANALPPGYRWTQGSPPLLRWTPDTSADLHRGDPDRW